MSELEIPLAHMQPQRCIFMYNLLVAETEVRMFMAIIALLCFAIFLLRKNEEGRVYVCGVDVDVDVDLMFLSSFYAIIEMIFSGVIYELK